jgi:Secretion system C-terminal sorting domain
VLCSAAWFSLPQYPGGLPAGQTLTWEISSNLREVSRTANSILVEPNFNASQAGGPGFVTAAVFNPSVSPLAFQTSRSRRDIQIGTPTNLGITITNQTNGTSFTTGQGGNLVLCGNRQNILLASYNQPGGVTGGTWQFPADWQVSQVSGSNSASVWPLGGSTGNIAYFPGNACGQATIPAAVPATVLFLGGPCGSGGWSLGRLSVWPNPATETVVVELPADLRGSGTPSSPTGLQLYSSMGQLVRSEPWPTGLASTSLDLRGLLPGVYLLQVTFADRVEVRRIVVGQPGNNLSN